MLTATNIRIGDIITSPGVTRTVTNVKDLDIGYFKMYSKTFGELRYTVTEYNGQINRRHWKHTHSKISLPPGV